MWLLSPADNVFHFTPAQIPKGSAPRPAEAPSFRFSRFPMLRNRWTRYGQMGGGDFYWPSQQSIGPNGVFVFSDLLLPVT